MAGFDLMADAVPPRTYRRFRDRILDMFRSPINIDYLRTHLSRRAPAGMRDAALDGLDAAVYEFSAATGGRALDLLGSDPLARRGNVSRGPDFWAEVRRLNRAFIEDRLAAGRDLYRGGDSVDDEPYAMRMFIADSLRPPGLEHLNAAGPLYAIREDQVSARPACRARVPFESFSTRPVFDGVPIDSGDGVPIGGAPSGGCRGGRCGPAARGRPKESFISADEDYGGGHFSGDTYVRDGPVGDRHDREYTTHDAVGIDYVDLDEDSPWRAGRPDRTPEQVIAEYWGEDRVSSDVPMDAAERGGAAYGDKYAWGSTWREKGGRFMRRESIPFWQKGGREGYDTDIEETLGTAGRELDNHVRRWDLDRVRDPRGQEYRRYGPR